MAPVPEANICCSGVMPPPGLGDIFSAMALSPCNARQGMLGAGGSLCRDEVPREPPPASPLQQGEDRCPTPAVLSLQHTAGEGPPIIRVSWGGDRDWLPGPAQP